MTDELIFQKVEPNKVYGTAKYSLDSSVCQAAIHDGRIVAHQGGTVSFNTAAKGPESGFIASDQNGIWSQEAPTAPTGM